MSDLVLLMLVASASAAGTVAFVFAWIHLERG